jgi:pimeloyl-ACP methyl ester carboxylesterase
MYAREALAGVHQGAVMVDGYRMHYEVEGPASGAPVVLIHGLGGRSEDWRALAPRLAQAGFRVYTPDLIGYGRSERPANFSYSVRDEAEVTIGFMNAMNLRQVELGGWSMGGWIVQLAAAGHPERVKRLMLFDSAGLLVPPQWDTRLFTPTTAAQLAALDQLLMPHPPPVPGFVATDILRVSRQRGWVVKRALEAMMTGHDVTDDLLPGLKMPVLIEWGAEDRITPVNQAETMHRLIPQSRLDVYAGCGHLAALQCAPQMAPNVVQFLEAPASASTTALHARN